MTLPARLRLWPTAEELRRMAHHPAAYAPTAAEVLAPPPVPLPTVPMGAEERRLMNAILAKPDADEPRWQFADCVEASDPERAAFIRDQIAGSLRDHSKRVPDRWLAPFLAFGARDLVFRRGFAEAMSLTGRSFISLSDGLFAATPLREVRLIAVNFLIPELVQCPNLRKLTQLDLRGNQIDQEGSQLLAGCRWLKGVAVLL
ncbi:MAG: TIGR02996 domain-containing protein [Fimbriiglobus sp.]|jgi:uncharacterized protein (TIGR02996 family)|nr:TIGR02996 domain-containing protein [Fimbriiglobus sp.]